MSSLERQTQYEIRFNAYAFAKMSIIKLDPVQIFFHGKLVINALAALSILLACGILCEALLRRRRRFAQPALRGGT